MRAQYFQLSSFLRAITYTDIHICVKEKWVWHQFDGEAGVVANALRTTRSTHLREKGTSLSRGWCTTRATDRAGGCEFILRRCAETVVCPAVLARQTESHVRLYHKKREIQNSRKGNI